MTIAYTNHGSRGVRGVFSITPNTNSYNNMNNEKKKFFPMHFYVGKEMWFINEDGTNDMVESYVLELKNIFSRTKLRAILIWTIDKLLDYLYNTEEKDET